MPQWNKGQQEVLDSINDKQNILVSAAAGSGKTAVLVERIIRTVLEGKADIDEILVVTFTRAAASQMRAKIIDALEKAVSEKPESDLAKQLMLAETADIMTIDSFCHKIVKENFQIAGVDPAFDIYDKEEIVLLTEDVLDEVMDEHYKNDESFRHLARFLMKKNLNDESLREYILNIFRVSESFADPVKWLLGAKEEVKQLKETGSTKWIEDYRSYIRTLAEGYYEFLMRRADGAMEKIAPVNSGTAEKLYEMYVSDAMIMRTISEQGTSGDMAKAVPEKWTPNFPRKPVSEVLGDDEMKELADERDKIKQSVKSIYSEENLLKEIESSAEYVSCLVNVVLEFREALLKEKQLQGKYEFSDISHAAYRVLFDTEKGMPTDTGIRMAEIYKYIYIDEYQDSNDLQENIINAVARRDEEGNINNVFMVGDIKQSIYRFRLARPDLFAEKAERYSGGEGGRLITLNMNYRSRREVLEASNYIFRELMSKNFGGIEYDEAAELHTPDIDAYNESFPVSEEEISGKPELIMINTEKDEDTEEDIELSNEEQEAAVIGKRILELVYGDKENHKEPLMVKNENYNPKRPVSEHNSVYRPVRFGDIVILQRKVRGSSGMLRVYEQMGIPVTVEDSSGYFDAMEVVTMLSLLRVIDNIQQDIPLASVLLSGMGGFSDDELALIVSLSEDKYISLADKMVAFEEGYLGNDSEAGRVAEKIQRIRNLIDGWSKLRPYISIAQLLDRIIADTGYDEYIAAMPDGEKRVANLKNLKIRANHFESVRNNGLLDFLNYINKCQIHNIDFGEASLSERMGDSVTIMSIHKSKGLEFPVVFVSRLGQKFRLREMSENVVVDNDYYIAMNKYYYVGDRIMVKRNSLKKDVVKLLSEKEIKTEEVRLLYVAMTRAKEKLIMTGCYSKSVPAMPLTCSSMMDYIRYAMSQKTPDAYLEVRNLSMYEVESKFKKLYIKKSIDYGEDMIRLLELLDKESEKVESADPYSFVYPYEELTRVGAKMSVSDIKHSEMEKNLSLIDNAEAYNLPNETELETSDIPAEAASTDSMEEMRKRAAQRGTIIHSLFEKLDYNRVTSKETLQDELKRVLSGKGYTDEDRGLINVKRLSGFFSDSDASLFSRMKKAALSDKLFREQQFIVGLTNSEIPGRNLHSEDRVEGSEKSDEDLTVVQGIIDAYFYEKDENDEENIILVDYKTDNVKDGKELLDRYASQMYLYALTLEKLTGKTVKDVILYSTRFGEVHYPEWREYNTK
ncbi:DNA helicase/exodeoxyribonuclease V, subunit A [Lachnospiraceae bacterium]|nr:DNA helicase/exodeoxyribonuclease V, subunit A [Lachnospiraceae bacterium]